MTDLHDPDRSRDPRRLDDVHPGAARDGPMTADPRIATLEDLTSLLLEEASLEQLLEQVLELTLGALRTAAAVSVAVTEDDGRDVTIARTHRDAAAVDTLQYELAEGPCIDALRHGEERYAADFGSDGRWPAIAERSTEVGLRCLLAVPLVVGGTCIGALNVFGAEVDGLAEDDRELARRIAAPAATILANARAYRRVSQLTEQLQEALENRAVIERAKGAIMVRDGCDAEGAFETLRRASQAHNRKLRDVARTVVAAVERSADPSRPG
jgi:GAF domain-containing protein